jgi:hypothetical protein
MFEPAGQYHMTVEPLGARSYLCERHAGLKGDPGFFREHSHRPAPPDRFHYRVKERADFRGLAIEMAVQVLSTAEVGLISIRERAAAFWTLPKRALGSRWHGACSRRNWGKQPLRNLDRRAACVIVPPCSEVNARGDPGEIAATIPARMCYHGDISCKHRKSQVFGQNLERSGKLGRNIK